MRRPPVLLFFLLVLPFSGCDVLSRLFSPLREQVGKPIIRPDAGIYLTAPISVSIITETPGAVIHYTLDGSPLAETSERYTEPVSLSKPATVKAAATKDGMDPSEIAEAIYDIRVPAAPEPEPAVPVLSVSATALMINYGDTASFEIWNSGTGTLDWVVSGEAGWLSFSAVSGSSAGERDAVVLSVDWNSFSIGDIKTSLITLGPGSKTIPVTAEKVPVPKMTLSPDPPVLGETLTVTCDLTDLRAGGKAAFFFNRGSTFIYQIAIGTDSTGRAVLTKFIPSVWLPGFAVQCRDDTLNTPKEQKRTSPWVTLTIERPARKVVINEFVYAGAGTGSPEFVELYNAGTGPADISGWVLRSFNLSVAEVYAEYAVPGNPRSGATLLQPCARYVVGAAGVPEVDQVFGGGGTDGLFADRNGAIRLTDDTGAVMDTVCYEIYRGVINTQVKSEGGIHGIFRSDTGTSWSRYLDGWDNNNNGMDFGVRTATPGAANTPETVTVYMGPDVDGLPAGSHPDGFHGIFAKPVVIDPSTADSFNPSAISASDSAGASAPGNGGNAVIVWNYQSSSSSRSNGAGSDFTLGTNASYDICVYIDPTLLPAGNSEEWNIGLAGTEDASANPLYGPDGNNGSTGISWVFQRNDTSAVLKLVHHMEGKPHAKWDTRGTVTLTGVPAGWHRLKIAVNNLSLTGSYDDTRFTGSIPWQLFGLLGNFYVGYNESILDDVLCRPPTIDEPK